MQEEVGGGGGCRREEGGELVLEILHSFGNLAEFWKSGLVLESRGIGRGGCRREEGEEKGKREEGGGNITGSVNCC